MKQNRLIYVIYLPVMLIAIGCSKDGVTSSGCGGGCGGVSGLYEGGYTYKDGYGDIIDGVNNTGTYYYTRNQ